MAKCRDAKRKEDCESAECTWEEPSYVLRRIGKTGECTPTDTKRGSLRSAFRRAGALGLAVGAASFFPTTRASSTSATGQTVVPYDEMLRKEAKIAALQHELGQGAVQLTQARAEADSAKQAAMELAAKKSKTDLELRNARIAKEELAEANMQFKLAQNATDVGKQEQAKSTGDWYTTGIAGAVVGAAAGAGWQRRNLQDELDATQEKLKTLAIAQETTGTQLREAKTRLQDKELDLQTTQLELNTLRKKHVALVEEASRHGEKDEILKKQLQEAKQRLSELDDENLTVKKDKKLLNEKIEMLQRSTQELENEIEKQTSEKAAETQRLLESIQTLNEQAENLQEEVDRLQQEVDIYNTMNSVDEEKEELEQNVIQLQKELEKKNEELLMQPNNEIRTQLETDAQKLEEDKEEAALRRVHRMEQLHAEDLAKAARDDRDATTRYDVLERSDQHTGSSQRRSILIWCRSR